MPKRIQMSRRRGWRKPPGALYVGRPTRWGNPFVISTGDREAAVSAYRRWIREPAQAGLRHAVATTLAGHDLACWCPPGVSCHADVLLEVANEESAPRPA